MPRQHDSTVLPTDFSSVDDDEKSPSSPSQIMKKAAVRQENKIDEKAVAQELTGNQEEEEASATCPRDR